MKKIFSVFIVMLVIIMVSYVGRDVSLITIMSVYDICEYSNCNNCELIKVKGDIYDVANNLDIAVVNKISGTNGIIILEGYVSSLKEFNVVGGCKVNIQMSQQGEYVLVGYPFIQDSY